jgi:nucleoside-diphosphate-sugar epimerase
VPRSFIGFVDVRDVAFAHAEAAFRPDASGRHIICGECTDMATAGRYMAGLFPGRPIPKRPLPDVLAYIVGPLVVGWSLRYIRRNIGVPITFDNARSRERLGMSYRPLRETLRDHGEQVLRDGLA